LDIKLKKISKNRAYSYGLFWMISILFSLLCSMNTIYQEYLLFCDQYGYGVMQRKLFGRDINLIFGLLYISLILLILICIVLYFCKIQPGDKMLLGDKISFELVLCLCIIGTIILAQKSDLWFWAKNDWSNDAIWMDDLLNMYENNVYSTTIIFNIISVFLKFIFGSFTYLVMITIFVRRIKSGWIAKTSFLANILNHYLFIQRQQPIFKRIYKRKIVFTVMQIFLIGYEMCWYIFDLNVQSKTLNLILVIGIPCIVEIILVAWFVVKSDFEYDVAILSKQISQVSKGEVNVENRLTKQSIIYQLGEDIMHLDETLKESMEGWIRNEKLKVDLITNISHDLKTPLTSMIGYIDLLERENYVTEDGKDYLHKLSKKAESLHIMIKELFDLAKVTSGNASLTIQPLDLNKLIIQTMCDMEDTIATSGFVIKQNLMEQAVKFLGDGTQLYRVIQNLIENALKYAMTGTRIFISTYLEDNRVFFTIQNTASYEMNFTSEEIAGRFVRGNESRAGEGNGLGLAIAKSYTQICGGTFEIIVEGDMFKVKISFECMK